MSQLKHNCTFLSETFIMFSYYHIACFFLICLDDLGSKYKRAKHQLCFVHKWTDNSLFCLRHKWAENKAC